MLPLVRAGFGLAVALPLAFASDSLSIAVMEIVDNGIMLAVPGAMEAPLSNVLFWGALALALAVAFVVAFPVNRSLIARGRGHAVVHGAHGGEAAGALQPGAPRRFALLGAASVAVTIVVAVGAALLLERGHEDEDDATPLEHEATPAPGR